jgi:sigma-B regulation protein RsbU (phosphoserine phosphatase)
MSESLQRLLLGAHPEEVLPGISVASFFEAALDEAAVGGDSCDAFPLTRDRIALWVADASGKGLAAAERIAEVRFALRAFLREHDDPCRAVACLNDYVCASQRLGRRDCAAFVTLTLVVLNNTTGDTQCLCAGGEPPLALRSCGAVESISASGTALGLHPRLSYEAGRNRLAAGDAVLLVTDGITEARHLRRGTQSGAQESSFLGLDGLARLARRAGQDPPFSLHQWGQRIFESARAFADDAFHDDACLLIARREPFFSSALPAERFIR